jgi:hypothetical protein
MSDEKTKCWQTKIWIGADSDQPMTIFGATLTELRQAVTAWLQENKPLFFSNAPSSYEYSRRVNYFYSDGTRVPIVPLRRGGEDNPPLEEGWYYVAGASPYSWPQHCEDFDETVRHFVTQSMIIEKGPAYREIPLTESGFPVYLVKSVKRERNIQKVNDLLQQGWNVLALEFDEYQDGPGPSVRRTTIFLLGHAEENAYVGDSEDRF